MASTTRGSIKISTANGIGAALVDVLGGEGYKPDEWEQNINICGIHAADIESALENIEEDAGTGTERGSILLSTANAIGATLNKKFNTSRGFSPREWASAASKLEPLPERTASGTIASFSDGADNVPMKSVVAHIASTLTGTNAVNMVQTGKNLLQNLKYQATANRVNIGQSDDGFSISLRAGTYTLSVSSSINISAYYRGENDGSNTLIWSTYSTSGSGTFTLSEDKDVRMWVIGQDGSVSTSDVLTIQLEYGSTASSYEPYTEPTSYTANLGRTVYGADVDLVTGEGEATYQLFTLNGSESENYAGSGTRIAFTSLQSIITPNMANNTLIDGDICSHFPQKTNDQTYSNQVGFSVSATAIPYIYFCDGSGSMTVSNFKTWLQNNPITLILKVKIPETFTFDGQEIPSMLGVNNLWSDQGESSVTYRKDLDIPDPVPGNLLGMNNGNNKEESEG